MRLRTDQASQVSYRFRIATCPRRGQYAERVFGRRRFLTGYLAILVTPGPNMLSVAGIATVGGIRTALPLCVGIAVGAGALCSAVMLATVLERPNDTFSRVIGAGLLIWVAVGIARRRVRPAGRTGRAAVFASGLATAALNPATAAYFVSASLSTGRIIAHPLLVSLLVLATALLFFTTVAFALGHPVARQSFVRWDRQVRISSAALLALMAFRTALPLMV